MNPDLQIPYSMQYSLTIEHSRWDTGFRLSYIGTNTRQGDYAYNYNSPVPDGQLFVNKPRPFPQYPGINYFTNGAGHQFHSLTAEVERRLARDETSAELLGEGEIVAILPQGHPLANKRILMPPDLESVPLVILDAASPPSHLVDQTFRDAGVRMNVVLAVNNTAVAISAAAKSGLGVALVDPWASLQSSLSGLVLRPFKPRVPLRIVLLRSPSRPATAIDSAMIVEIRSLRASELAAAGKHMKMPHCEAPGELASRRANPRPPSKLPAAAMHVGAR